MSIYPKGECYIWYCDWCDSTNQVHWSRLQQGELTCGACHHPKGDVDVEELGLLRRAA